MTANTTSTLPTFEYVSPYETQTWINGESPLDQERMNHIEAGISKAYGNVIEINGDPPFTIATGLSPIDLFNSVFYMNKNEVMRPIDVYMSDANIYYISSCVDSPMTLMYDASTGQLDVLDTSDDTSSK